MRWRKGEREKERERKREQEKESEREGGDLESHKHAVVKSQTL